MTQVARDWGSLLREWFHIDLPKDYLSFDLETTGFSREWDVPVDFGWCIVRDQQIVHRGNYVLDWTRYPEIVDPQWLVRQFDRIDQKMAEQHRPWVYTFQYLQENGKDPFWVLQYAHELLTANRESGAMFVGHNALAYDAAMLSHVFPEFINLEWEFGPDELLDTGAMQKITESFALLDPRNHFSPRSGETLGKFLRRVAASHRRVPWNIEHCVDVYDLCHRFQLCKETLHGAGPDSYACHLIVECNRG